MNSSDFASKMLKGRDVSAAPRINNYNKSMNIKKVQSGRSMIEMLGVLAIIGVLSVGGIAGYSKAMMKYRINKTIEQITLITGNMRSFFKDKYPNLSCVIEDDVFEDSCKIIRKAKIFPDEMITLTSDGKIDAITNAFGSISVWSSNNEFFLDFLDIPQEACIELATYDWRPAGIPLVGFYSNTDYYAKVPISVDKAIEYCKEDPIEMFFAYTMNPDNDSSWPKAE